MQGVSSGYITTISGRASNTRNISGDVLKNYARNAGYDVYVFTVGFDVGLGSNINIALYAKKSTQVELNRLVSEFRGLLNNNGFTNISLFGKFAGTDVAANTTTNNNILNTVLENVNTNNRLSYIVVRGDTLGKIARQYNTTIGALISANGFTTAQANNLNVGQRIIIGGAGNVMPTINNNGNANNTNNSNNAANNNNVPPPKEKTITDYIKENQTYIYAAAAIGVILMLMED